MGLQRPGGACAGGPVGHGWHRRRLQAGPRGARHGGVIDGLRALFHRIYPAEDDPQYRPVKQVLDRVKAVTDFRNSVVHALWHVDDAGMPHAVRFQARVKLTRSIQPTPVEKIREYTLEAQGLAGTLGDLASAYRGWARIDPR
jgi:hypothetical protein